ncbi:hypothetical protein ABZ705_28205 [Streptomyces sp. NPDC006984]|uniref:hypothetical protein n=1 Tax=Streptomyces sp. NPDC006984 TaxID=3155463 RepID=UPI0033CBA124
MAPEPQRPSAGTAPTEPGEAATAVNSALHEADTHTPVLQDMPEWQRIQTVRGALGHLMHVIKDRAGEHLDNFLNDHRVGDYLRRLSIRACERIAEWAQAGADWLREKAQRDPAGREELPSADALMRLGDAAVRYSGPRRPSGHGPSASVPGEVDVPALRAMGEALGKPLPGRRVATAAARGRSTTIASAAGANRPSRSLPGEQPRPSRVEPVSHKPRSR